MFAERTEGAKTSLVPHPLNASRSTPSPTGEGKIKWPRNFPAFVSCFCKVLCEAWFKTHRYRDAPHHEVFLSHSLSRFLNHIDLRSHPHPGPSRSAVSKDRNC